MRGLLDWRLWAIGILLTVVVCIFDAYGSANAAAGLLAGVVTVLIHTKLYPEKWE